MRRHLTKTIVVFVTALLFLSFIPNRTCAVDAEVIAEDLDNYFIPAFPDVYGQIIDRTLSEKSLQDIAPINKGLEIFGYIKAIGDIANKLDEGDTSGATVDAALNACKVIATFLTDETTKKVVLGSVGLSTAVVTGVFVTIDITRASYKAVEESKTALDLERLYYKIEADHVLKTPGRKLGQGDPIRQDQQAVEHLWRKVLSDNEFQSVFKAYVTTELGQTWPEPTIWEKITISSEFLSEAKLLEEQKRLKGHIKGLLSEMNKTAKKREAATVLAQQLREISAMGANFSPLEFQRALGAYQNALKILPDVEKYLASFSAKVADLNSRYDKANSSELMDIKKGIVAEQKLIRYYAEAMRGFPTVGRMGGKRTQVLNELKGAYSQLNKLYNSLGNAEIDRRLAEQSKRIAAEVAKLDTGGIDFEFKRYECKKTFDEMKSQFYEPVMKGTKDAEQSIYNAIQEVKRHKEEITQNYEKNLVENQKKYNDADARVREEIAKINKEYEQTKNPDARALLYTQLEKLRNQAEGLKERFYKYRNIHTSTSQIDREGCENTVTKIQQFYQANYNRFSIIHNSVRRQYSNAIDLYNRFLNNHGSSKYRGTQNFLSAEKIGELRKRIETAPPVYAGIDLKFLKNHIKMDKQTPVSVGLTATLAEISDALIKYRNATGALRMQYTTDDEASILPSLKFMESKEASEKVDKLLETFDDAITAYERVDNRNIPESSRQEFSDNLKELRVKKKEIEEYRKLISLASGLSPLMEQYLTKAKTQNASIEEDVSYLSWLWNKFHVARQLVLAEVGRYTFSQNLYYTAQKSATIPPFLSGEKIREALAYTDILSLSKKLQLGIETFIPDNFVEVKWKGRYITICPDDLNILSGKIQGLSINDYDAFYKSLHAMRTLDSPEGFIMDGYFTAGNNLWAIFDSNVSLQGAANKLKETLAKQRDLAQKVHYQKSLEEGQFSSILGKVNQAIITVKGFIANGEYDNAIMYYIVRDDLLVQYGNLGKKRSDVDAALKELQDLIEQAKTQKVSPARIAISHGVDQSQKVRELYIQFKDAYESKNITKVMGYISNQWRSGDGGSISDLQRQLQKIFNMFDEIRFTIQNLLINKEAEGKYRVNYDATITSRIYKRNLKHEEKSNIEEIVMIDQSGQPKILMTIGGKLLSVK